MKKLFLTLLLFPCLVLAQHNLSVEISNVKTSNGTINIAIYDGSDGFLKFDQVFMADSVVAQKGKTQLRISGLPDGEYALAIFHDENGNQKLDTNWLGIPKEAIGFSNARMKTFGPPRFKECAFTLRENQKIEISL
ncbi:MAG: DUF2141 domain-containing protein [Eudoraea sp.]|nr:DUF2141 domain-containing protein [Eudoraea sp.]